MGKGSIVGLNIGSNTIKVAELQRGRGGIEVTAIGIAPTPEDTISNGVITAPEVLGEAIKDLLSSSGVRSRAAVSSVAGQSSLVIRIIEMPKMSDAELKETMSYEVERHIPFAATEVIMDYKPLRPPEEDPDAQNMEVLLCVAQEDMINAHVETLEAAGLRPQAIDIEPLSAARASIELVGESTPGEAIGILNIGASVTDITVVRDGLLNFTRAVPIAGDTLTQAIMDAFGVQKFEAERIKKELGAAILEEQHPVGDVDFSGGVRGAQVADMSGSTEPDFGAATTAAPREEAESSPDAGSEDFFAFDTETPGGTAESAPQSASPAEPADSPSLELNPFDLSLEEEPSAGPTTPPSDNPFDLSLDDSSKDTSQASSPENPFDLSFDDSSAKPAEEPAPPPPAFDLGDSVPSQGEEEPLFDFGGLEDLSVEATPSAQPEDETVADVSALDTNPFFEGTGADENIFGEENIFTDSTSTALAPQQEITPATVFRALSPALEELVTEVRRSLEYYTSRYPNTVISRLVLMGGTARLKHLDKLLSNELGIRVVIANPFEHLVLKSKNIPPEYAEELAPTLAVSIGLALRELL